MAANHPTKLRMASARLPIELHDELDTEAARRGMTKTELIVLALTQWFRGNRAPAPKKAVAKSNGALFG